MARFSIYTQDGQQVKCEHPSLEGLVEHLSELEREGTRYFVTGDRCVRLDKILRIVKIADVGLGERTFR